MQFPVGSLTCYQRSFISTKNFALQASYTALNMMLNSLNDEARLALLCENFAYLNSEERAGILFTTSDDVKYFLQLKYFLFQNYF